MNHCDAKTTLYAGMMISSPRRPPEGGVPFVVLPDHCRAESLEHLLHDPPRIKRVVTLHDPEAFVTYVKRFREPGTTIFFDQDEETFSAILDYHEGSEVVVEEDGESRTVMDEVTPRWCDHRAEFKVRETPEWTRWKAADGQPFRQTDFARFVENNIHDVAGDFGSTLLKIALNLSIRKSVWFQSDQVLENGSAKLIYNEDVEGTASTGSITIPPTFTLRIQPYMGGPEFEIVCRLRYRLDNRALVIWFEMVQREKVIETALNRIRTVIEEQTGIKVLAGAPGWQPPR